MSRADLGVTDSGLPPHIAAVLCYFPFWLGLLVAFFFLVSESGNRFVRFHAMQAVLLGTAAFAIWLSFYIAYLVVWFPLYAVLFLPVAILAWIAFLVAWLWTMYQAYLGIEYRLPLIGDLAVKAAP